MSRRTPRERHPRTRFGYLVSSALAACACTSSPATPSAGSHPPDGGITTGPADASVLGHVVLPSASPGIGFDDLEFAPYLGKILAPAGRTGNLDLVDPDTEEVTAIGGFSTSDQYAAGGHDFGTTSAVEGPGGTLFATDQTTDQLHVVDPTTKTIVSSTSLSAHPDYVRWIESKKEVWVTEPDVGQLEIISVSGTPPSLSPVTTLAVGKGPESLVIDATRKRAYTNSFLGSTYSIDIDARSIVETWPNGCTISLGLALDEARGFAFVGCSAGSAVVLDVANGGKTLATATTGGGVDIVAYSPWTGHLYVPSSTPKTLTIFGVSKSGDLTPLGIVEGGGAGVAADDRNQAWVTDPDNGALIRVRDGYAKTN